MGSTANAGGPTLQTSCSHRLVVVRGMLTKTQVAEAERSWRGIVFGATARRFLLSWLGLGFAAIVASVIPGLRSAAAAAMRYVVPAGFVIIVWVTASSYALTAALSFMRREIGLGVWMSVWAIILAFLGATVVHFVVYG